MGHMVRTVRLDMSEMIPPHCLGRRASASPTWFVRWTGAAASVCSNCLLDDFIRPLQQRRRDCQAEGLGGLEVDNQLELGRLLDGEIAGLGALEDLVDVASSMAELVGVVR